mgnify:CR=1 FL=1
MNGKIACLLAFANTCAEIRKVTIKPVVSCNIKIFTFALSPVSRELSQRESLMNSKPRPWGEVARGGVPRSELVSFGGSRDSVTERGEIQF